MISAPSSGSSIAHHASQPVAQQTPGRTGLGPSPVSPMQGRFGASIVDENRYILTLSRYVHLNPVFIRAHKSKSLAERTAILHSHKWSSYLSYIGKAKREDFVDYGPVLAMMDGSKKRIKSAYRRFVESGIMDIDSAVIVAKHSSRLCIGSDESVERIERLYHELVDGRSQQEDISFRRQRCRVDHDTVLSAVCEVFKAERAALYRRTRGSLVRSMAAKCLCQWSGCTQREVGEILKIKNSPSVSKRLKRLNMLFETDKHAKRIQSEIERILTLKE